MSNTNNDSPVRKGCTVYVIVRKVFVYLLAVAIVAAGLLFAASNSPNKSLFWIPLLYGPHTVNAACL